MPSPVENEQEVPKFSDSELRVILQNCGPKNWKTSQVRAAYRPSNLSEQTQYFEGLRQLEGENNGSPRSNNRNQKNHNGGKSHRRNNHRNRKWQHQ